MYGHHLTSSECLCLVYNAENRIHMDQKHVELLTPLVSNNFVSYNTESDSYMNAGIKSHTLHSFCNYWIQEYLEILGLQDFKVMTSQEGNNFLNPAITKIQIKNKDYSSNTSNKKSKKELVSLERFQTLYDLVAGLQLSYDDILSNNPLLIEAISSCVLEPSEIVEVFKTYDNTKLFFKKYDFTDMLKFMNKLLDNPDVRNRMHLLYSYIIVDEIQDFTPLMMSILKKVIGENTRFLAIGDEDQSIYGFRGADVNNAVRFTEHFPESKVFQLTVNRRCGKNILDVANKVISLNNNRFEKELVATRDGGKVHLKSYATEKEQLNNLLNTILSYPSEELQTTIFCHREKIYGQPITFELFRNRIPFYTLNSLRFDSHEAFRGFLDIMKLIAYPHKAHWKNFYKCINVKKDEWFAYIGYNPKKNIVEKFEEVESLWELDFEPFMRYNTFPQILNNLKEISSLINTYNTSKYIDYVLDLFRFNFWSYRVSMSQIPFSEQAFEWIRNLFYKYIPFPSLLDNFNKQLSECNSVQKAKAGLVVATFHSLKGLEFKHVHITYLENSLFPAYSSIDIRNNSASIALSLKEAENRLAYVAFTRAKENLFLHYASYDPSYYISLLNNNSQQEVINTSPIMFSNKKTW